MGQIYQNDYCLQGTYNNNAVNRDGKKHLMDGLKKISTLFKKL